jgi:hypothetical protein
MAAHEKTFYLPRTPVDPIGVYFSPETRNYYAAKFIDSYRGVLVLLMQKHLSFQIVTPRTLAEFRGQTLVLPDIRMLNDTEKKWMKDFVAGGKRLVINGTDVADVGESTNTVRFKDDPGKTYNDALVKDFEHALPDSQREFLGGLRGGDTVHIQASPHVATSVSQTPDGHVNVFFANFDGLKGGVNPLQTPQRGVQVTVVSKSDLKGSFLPFLGDVQAVQGARRGDSVTFTLPTITKGAVFWYEQ